MKSWHWRVCGLAAALVGVLTLSLAGPIPGQDAKPPSLPAVEKDVPYAGGGDQQMLDLYLPNKKDFTTIVFTFGGGWHSGSRKSVKPIGEKLQSLGFGCALLSHRLAPQDTFPAQIEDVAAGFAWVKKNIAARGGDPKRIFLMGHSSGAHLSLLLAADPKFLARHNLTPADIAGVVGLSSPVDLEPRRDKGFGDVLLAGRGADVFSRDPAIMKGASPLQHVTKDLPPVLLVVGERDFPMLEADAKAFVEKAKAVKVPATVFVAKERDHMGVVQGLIEDKSPVLEQVLAFLSTETAEPQQPKALTDEYPYAGLPPRKAAEVMTVPDGFTVKLFAGEPDVHQPIALCIDDRGRLWVAEAYSYPVRRPDKEANDRILIFEDTDGDGVFDKKTVFMEGLNLVSGLEVGFGGVWIGAAPYLMFVPVKDGEDKPAGPPQILLDGWGYQDTHETLNTFTWGPDGWLYGCHGVFTHSRVGKPGTPDKERIPINAAVWRYHPTRHVFEVFAHGTSNPWGLDFDAHGQAFVEACVIPHNWHIIQGGRYHRQAGQHFNPHTYADIQTIAEHRHFVGADPWRAIGRSDSVGGGHAHAGTMIYQGGAWPKEYDGLMFMGNIHGHRLNVDKLTPKGSGFVATRAPDFLLANDAWARFINMQLAPDGNVYLIDWYDKQACHDGKVQVWDRSNGRIYKICHKDAKPVVGIDLNKKTNAELVELQLHPNEWYVRHARRILQERYEIRLQIQAGLSGSKQPSLREIGAFLVREFALDRLTEIALKHPDETKRLRGLWTLACLEGWIGWNRGANQNMAVENLGRILRDESPHVRAWAVRLLVDDPNFGLGELQRFVDFHGDDSSPIVRLQLASALQRLPSDERWAILQRLVAHAEDADDHNLPLMYWYAAEPLAEKDPAHALDLAFSSKVPPLPRFMARRVSSAGTSEAIATVLDRLASAKTVDLQLAILRGMQDALKGRRNLTMPAQWPAVFAALADSKNAEVRNAATVLAVTFGDPKAFAALRELVASSKSTPPARQEALATLLAARDQQLVPILHKLLDDSALRAPALRALAAYDDTSTPGRILAVYPALTTQEKRDAVNTLASRAGYGQALLDAVAAKKIAANEVSAEVVRQLRNLGDKALDQRIAEVWGIIRATPADRARQIADWRKFLSNPAKTDLSLGRAVFAKTCQQCHTLFGVGGQVGPDITGGNRASLDFLLENILDPSAVIPKEYTTTVLELKNGRVITGIVRGETPAALTVVTVNETLTIPRDDIDTMKSSNISMMPDDLLGPLTKDEVRALFAYLQSPIQVPLLGVPGGNHP